MADSAEVQLDKSKWDKFLTGIKNKLSKANNPTEIAGIIAATVFQDIMDHFDKEKGPDGKWEAWSTSYENHLKKIGRSGNKKLQFNGRLRQAFTPESYRTAPNTVIFFNNAQTKSGYAYAKGHDEGGSVKGRPPQRKFMWLSKKADKDIRDRISKWLKEG
jgi:phage gpG-like protein